MPDFANPDALREAFARARRAIEDDRPEVAEPILRDLLAARPDLADARFELARALSLSGDANAARAAFEAVLAVAPREPAIWVEYGLAAWRAGAGAHFAARLREAGLPRPLAAMAEGAARGTGARAQGKGTATRRELAGLERDPRGVEALATRLLARGPGAALWAALGRARLARGARAEATKAFRAGLALEPLAVDLRHGLARALAAEPGPEALAQARHAARAAPAWADAQATFARLCLRHGLGARALEAAEAALALTSRSDAAQALAAEAALACARPARAAELAEARAATAPGRDRLLGRALAAGGRSDAALAAFDSALATDPGDLDARLARAALRQSLGRGEEAGADLRAVLAARPDHGEAARALAYGTRLDPDGQEATAFREALAAPSTAPEDARGLAYALARVTERSDPAGKLRACWPAPRPPPPPRIPTIPPPTAPTSRG